MNAPINTVSSRREFLKTSALVGGALAAPAILPGKLFANERTDTLKVGLIGCGGRGTGAAGQAGGGASRPAGRARDRRQQGRSGDPGLDREAVDPDAAGQLQGLRQDRQVVVHALP